ncbi:GNAT family N-acetyltransferase [Alcaligenes nematophilus]|uniref:GNAT family N-acetyltransferase n=1 Tax=Alcaligenes nematophilus TaxID=2994643 RepID=UPI00384E6FE5
MTLQIEKFNNINLDDEFFDSLKNSYKEFNEWFENKGKNGESAYISKEDYDITGFLYLKLETEEHKDINPSLKSKKRTKIGTFKIDARGTKMGERFVKKIFDHATHHEVEEVYVTIFPEFQTLINLLERYGFERHGTKTTENGTEIVYLKKIDMLFDYDLVKTYPLIDNKNGNSHLIAIQPKWHTRLLPDSILKNEDERDLIEDISHTNSIHKVYLCNMSGVENINPGDRILIYRPGETDPKWFKSVATSICVAEEYKNINEFKSKDDFIKYCAPYSVFTQEELEKFWKEKKYPHIIKFMYNVALRKRPNMRSLVEDFGFDRTAYWGYREISNAQLAEIAIAGGINESLIID